MTYVPYPAAPPPPPPPSAPVPPAALRPVIVLLLVNLALSVAVTIAVVATRNSLVEFQLDHRHITDPQQRAILRGAYSAGIWGRAVGNIVASVVYTFLVRALLRGRRWAYRRVIFLGIAGIVGLLLLFATPYPSWMRVEQVLQALVLAALLYFVRRPEVRSHFPKVPGQRRFGR